MSVWRTGTRAAAWVLSGVVVVTTLAQPGGLLGRHFAVASGGVSVSGSVSDLLPGVPAQLLLVLDNDNSEPAVVQALRAVVAGGGTADCPATSLHVEPWQGRLVVPAHGTASQPLVITLDLAAQCDQVTWELRYTAQVH